MPLSPSTNEPRRPLAAEASRALALEPPCAGGLWLVPESRRGDACRELAARRFLVAPVTPTGARRGQLRAAIDDAVEGARALRGALPPCVDVDADPGELVRDQLLRLSALGAGGLALALPRLADLADPRGWLEVGDGLALATWMEAARHARSPVVLVADQGDEVVRIYAPRSLGELATPAPAPTVPDLEVDTAPTVSELLARAEAREAASAALVLEATAMPAVSAAPAPDEDLADAASAGAEPIPPARAAGEAATPVCPVQLVIEDPESARHRAEESLQGLGAAPPVGALAPDAPAAVDGDEPAPDADDEPAASEPPPARRAARVVNAAEWRGFAVDLDSARGPKPVSVVERLFMTRYMPLLGAEAGGEVDAAVRGVIEAWRAAFEHSYRDAFAALRVTGKRPPMVLDTPDIAGRIARLNGARAVKLVLVDSMRFDLGERVASRLDAALSGRAVGIERNLLWSALPTTTPTQLALLARGPEALRDPAPTSDREPDVSRGRAIATLRRERAGAREVMKLDLVEARLRSQGPSLEDRLDGIADEVAPILARYAEGLAPRTLLYVFGDHGFRMSAALDGRGTAPSTQGGASPEEVLVPGYAWLVGGVH